MDAAPEMAPASEGKEMSDKTGAPRPSRGGTGVILTGLAVGAILSTPVAASAAGPVEASSAGDTAATAIREQFQASFTPGVMAPTADVIAIIVQPE
jgi:NAD(P)H-hydrate repair Nnr-like enzyme with NAD(P)H-hydrate dehydratase domain